MKQPLLSIVIANYNYGRFLEEAINSVVSQGMGEKIELIICDAASTDNSVDIIKRYANGLPPKISYDEWMSQDNSRFTTRNPQLITWWCSEKDGGQSDAFNKGFSHARGKFFTWLNADDLFLPGCLEKFENAVFRHPKCEWFGGGSFFVDPALRVYKCARSRKISKYRVDHGMVGVTGPSSFFSRELYHRVGGLDDRFHYTMDTDLWMRFSVIAGARFIPFIRYAWVMRLHSQAKMSGHKFTKEGEILDGEASKKAFDKNLVRLKQIKMEEQWMLEKVAGAIAKPTRIGSFFSAKFLPALMSRIDTWRYRGKKYTKV